MSRSPRMFRKSTMFAVLVCAMSLVVVGVAGASKGVVSFLGSSSLGSGTTGGVFSSPRGVAVNESTGDIYVVDGVNNRVQRFTAAGGWVSAWGRDVIAGGATGVETCTVAADCKNGSSGNAAGQFNAPQGIAVDQATGDVYVSEQSNLRVQKFDAAGNFLRTWGRDVLSPAGGTTTEVCTAAEAVTPGCKVGTSGATGGAFASTFAGQLAVVPAGAPNAGNVLVADPGNRRVQEFTPAGVFVRAFGFDVVTAAGGADNTGTTFEICTAAVATAANCKAGVAGAGLGQFPNNEPKRVAADTTGVVYTVENSANFRVQKLTPQVGPPVLDPQVFAAGVLSGTLAADAPTDVAIGASNRVFVTKAFPAGTGTPAATVAERRVLELDSAGVLQDTHMALAEVNTANGLTVDRPDGEVLVSAEHFMGSNTAQRVYRLNDVAGPLTAAIAPATDVGARGATFNGQVNPGGNLAGYHFEYSKDGIDWNAFPPGDVSAGTGASTVAVAQTITGALEPSTLYHVRLVAKRMFAPETVTTAELTFVTDDAPPAIGTVLTADADVTTATLVGRVNPSNQPTTYRFEYGTTDSYGNEVPAGGVNVGNDNTSHLVSAQLTGLEPATTYHYRLTATNPTGTTQSGDRTFTTRPTPATGGCSNAELRKGVAAHLPDCRAYEQVSPTEKNGADAGFVSNAQAGIAGPVTADGNALAFFAFGAFAGTPWGGSSGALPYLSRRGPDGWSTTWIQPRPLGTPGLIAYGVPRFTPDLDSSLLSVAAPLTTEPAGKRNLYLQDHATRSLDLLAAMENGATAEVASVDLEHFAFDSLTALTDEPGQPATARKVYEAFDGEIRLVTRQPSTDLPFQSAASIGASGGEGAGEGSISDDGNHIFFTTPQTGTGSQIYRRSGGTSTELVSPSERAPADPLGSAAKVFQVATSDGSRVLFTSVERLTNDANSRAGTDRGDLYRYDAETDELVNVTAGTPGAAVADVQGVVGIDGRADRIYYTATGVVVNEPGPSGQLPVAGEPNLYVWEDSPGGGSTRFIGTLAPQLIEGQPLDATNWSWAVVKTSQTTANGGRLVLRSKMDLTGENSGGFPQVYLYDASADGGGGDLVCVSCPAGGGSGAALVPVKPDVSTLGAEFPRSMSDDGRRVFFSSPDPLVARDTNGKYDAYMWEGGEVFLLSSGKDADDSWSFGASASGDDAFFRTRERLVPQDGDTLVDIYTARIGGGLESQHESPVSGCEGDTCQGDPGSGPPPADIPSAGNQGAGNVQETPDCTRFAKSAKRFSLQARRLRRSANRAVGTRKAVRLRKRSTRLTRQAKQQRAKAKRCTARASQGASR